MSTTIDALRNLGNKVNGKVPESNYVNNVINEIANDYEGGGSGGASVIDLGEINLIYNQINGLDKIKTPTPAPSISAAIFGAIEASPESRIKLTGNIYFGSISGDPEFTMEIFGTPTYAQGHSYQYGVVNANGAGMSGLCGIIAINSSNYIVDITLGSVVVNPMTTDGDIIVGGTSGAPTRLAKGTQGQVLSVGSSGLEWANASSGGGSNAVVINITDSAFIDDFAGNGLTNMDTLGGSSTGMRIGGVSASLEYCKFTAAQTASIDDALANNKPLIIIIDETSQGIGKLIFTNPYVCENYIKLSCIFPGNDIGEFCAIQLSKSGSSVYEIDDIFFASPEVAIQILLEFTNNVATLVPSYDIQRAWELYGLIYNRPNLIINDIDGMWDKAIFIGYESSSSSSALVYKSYQYTYFIESVSSSGYKITRVANTPISRS